MFCSQCGKQIAENSRFCKSCGAPQQLVAAFTHAVPSQVQTNGDQERTIKEAGVHLLRSGPSAVMSQRRIIVTNRRVIYREGLVGKKERSVPLSKITDVSIRSSLAGQMAGYGTLRIESAGSSDTEIVAEDIADARGIRDAILSLLR